MPTFSVDQNLIAGGFYRTQSAQEGQYLVYDDVLQAVDSLIVRSGDPDRSLTPTQLDGADCPMVGSVRGNRLRLRIVRRQFAANGGLPTPFDRTVGQATLLMNLAGNLSLDSTSPSPPATVKVLARYLMDGEVHTSINSVPGGTLNASIDVAISIDGLGVANANGTQAGLTGGTLGLTPSFSPTGPGLQGAIGLTSQPVASGVTLRNLAVPGGQLPVGSPIPWSFTLTLRAENDKQFVGPGCTAADALITSVWVELTLTSAASDPLYSSSVFSFDTTTGLLGIAHPLAALAPVDSIPGILAPSVEGDPPEFSDTVALGDRQNLLPEVELILENDEVQDSDELLGSLLSYSNITFEGENQDGTLGFSDGQLTFLDPADGTTIKASCDISGILADPSSDTFVGSISNFQFGTLSATDTPIGDALSNNGGTIEFDPEIIDETSSFTTEGSTRTPWSVVLTPN
jgi:hypothetical protein